MTSTRTLRITRDVTLQIRDTLLPPAARDQRFEVRDATCPQLTLDVIRDHPPPALDGAQPLLDTHSLWRVARAGAEHIFELPQARAVVNFEAGEGRVYPSDPAAPFDLGFPLDEVLFARLLADRTALIVHACGIDDGGRGVLFAGHSGSGKSTLADLFASEGGQVLNDDRCALGLHVGKVQITGTPWHGTSGHATPQSAPLVALFFLHHATRNQLKTMSPLEAAAQLVALCVLPYWHRPACERALDTALAVVEKVPVFELGFVPDRTACAHVAEVLQSL